MHNLAIRCALTLLPALLLSACASQVPQLIREAPTVNTTLEQVRAQDADHLGQQVRWGGTLVETNNRENATWLTVLARPLYKGGEPELTDDSAGRFIAIVPEFLDPTLYAPDRRVTVTGTLLRTETDKIGEFSYTYAIIQADAWHLWPAKTEQPYKQDPWHYGPWYGPWYPYGYPYHHRH